MNFEAWNDLPAHAQQHIIAQAALPDAACAAGACRDIYAYVQEDQRWTSLISPRCAAGSAYRRTSENLNRAVIGPQTRTVIKAMLTTLPLRPVVQACADALYITANLADWQQQEEARGNHRAAELVARINEARRTKASKIDLAGMPMYTLPESIGQLKNLQKLSLYGCTALTALPESLGQLTALQALHLAGCTNLTALPECLGQLTALQELYLGRCRALIALPESIGQLKALLILNMFGCTNLTALPKSLEQLNALQRFYLSDGFVLLPPATVKLLKNRGCIVIY